MVSFAFAGSWDKISPLLNKAHGLWEKPELLSITLLDIKSNQPAASDNPDIKTMHIKVGPQHQQDLFVNYTFNTRFQNPSPSAFKASGLQKKGIGNGFDVMALQMKGLGKSLIIFSPHDDYFKKDPDNPDYNPPDYMSEFIKTSTTLGYMQPADGRYLKTLFDSQQSALTTKAEVTQALQRITERKKASKLTQT